MFWLHKLAAVIVWNQELNKESGPIEGTIQIYDQSSLLYLAPTVINRRYCICSLFRIVYNGCYKCISTSKQTHKITTRFWRNPSKTFGLDVKPQEGVLHVKVIKSFFNIIFIYQNCMIIYFSQKHCSKQLKKSITTNKQKSLQWCHELGYYLIHANYTDIYRYSTM